MKQATATPITAAEKRRQTTVERKLSELVVERLRLADAIADLEAELESVDKTLIDALDIGGTFEVPGLVQVTVVQQTSHTIDLDAVTTLHPTWARKITKKVVDVAKFNLLRNAGELPHDVAALVQQKKSAPFLRFTKR